MEYLSKGRLNLRRVYKTSWEGKNEHYNIEASDENNVIAYMEAYVFFYSTEYPTSAVIYPLNRGEFDGTFYLADRHKFLLLLAKN